MFGQSCLCTLGCWRFGVMGILNVDFKAGYFCPPSILEIKMEFEKDLIGFQINKKMKLWSMFDKSWSMDEIKVSIWCFSPAEFLTMWTFRRVFSSPLRPNLILTFRQNNDLLCSKRNSHKSSWPKAETERERDYIHLLFIKNLLRIYHVPRILLVAQNNTKIVALVEQAF